MKGLLLLLSVPPCLCLAGWTIDGDRGIVYESPRGVSDQCEMSSRGVDAVVRCRDTKSHGIGDLNVRSLDGVVLPTDNGECARA